MAEKADLHRRPQRATLKDILRTAVDMEKKTMALYIRFARVFQPQEELRAFWFTMARHEAGLLDRDPLARLPTIRAEQRTQPYDSGRVEPHLAVLGQGGLAFQ